MRQLQQGLLIVDGQVLCELCAGRWKEQVRQRLLLDRGEDCQLTRSHSTSLKRALAAEVETAWLVRPTTEDFGVPAKIM